MIVDDEPRITRILDLQLKRAGYRTITAHDGKSAAQIALEQPVSIVLMDIMMPEMDGIEAMKIIKASKPGMPILLLTAKDDTEDIVEGLDEGADEYVTKPFVFEELHARIRARLRGASASSAGQSVRIQYKSIVMDTSTFETTINGKAAALSKTEFDLLSYFLQHTGKVISREELLENVWGYSFGGSNIVDVYINYLRDKIAQHTEEKIIETVRGRGYIVH